MFIDAHTHLADPRFEGKLEEVLARSRAAGITAWIQGGVGPEDWDRQLALAARYEGFHPCLGLHPWWVAAHSEEECRGALERLEALLERSVGLGELGLDHGPRWVAARERQLRIFREQLALACRRAKPLVLHVVRAHEEALEVLGDIGVPEAGGIVHSFSGNATFARRYLELGLSISVSGGVGRKGFETLKRAVVSLPPERLLLETDSPDQGAQPGELNEPANLLETARALGALRGEDAGELLRKSSGNAKRIFSI